MSLTAALPKTGAPRRKKPKGKKQKKVQTTTVHVVQEPEEQIGEDVEEDVERVAVAGLAFPDTDQAEADPEVEADQVEESSLTGRQLRQQRSLATRSLAQAKELGYDPDDARFVAAKTDGATFTYARALTEEQRGLVTAKEIRDQTVISQDVWDGRRRLRVDLLTADDKTVVAARWGMKPDHTNVVKALGSQADWTFALSLTAEQMTYISATKWKQRQVPSADDIANMKQVRAKAEAEAKALKEKQDKENEAKAKKEAAAEKRTQDVASWEKHRDSVRTNIKARLAVEASGLAPETIEALMKGTEALVTGTEKEITDKVGINVDRQIKSLDKQINDEIAKAKLRSQIDAAKAPYKWLKGNILRDLIEKIASDPTKKLADFTAAADQARVDQRNLLHLGVDSRKAEWARLLGITIYKKGADTPFERLTDRVDLKTHYSVDLRGFNSTTALTKDSTDAQLLDAVFGVADRFLRLHVTLETGAKDKLGDLALPHRYWGLPANQAYDYTCDNGTRNRWFGGADGHTKAEVKQGLDEAYTEMRDRLLVRARTALDQDCNV